MFSLMLFIFLCFLGMLAVQFYMLRTQERLNRALRDEHAQMRVLLRAMEARLDALGCPAPKLAETAVQATPAAQDPLLHLSLEAPAAGRPRPALRPWIRRWTCTWTAAVSLFRPFPLRRETVFCSPGQSPGMRPAPAPRQRFVT